MENVTPPSLPPWRTRALPLAGRLVLELLVVFIGVYAASMFAQRQALRAEVDRAQALRRALVAELAFIHGEGRKISGDLAGIDAYAAAIDGGSRPPLQPLASRIPFAPDVWEAALASGGVQLFDPDVVVGLSKFYGAMRALTAELDEHRAYTRALLLPNLDRPPSEFYGEDGALRPKYAWYLEHLRWLSRQIPMLTAEADSLRAVLAEGG